MFQAATNSAAPAPRFTTGQALAAVGEGDEIKSPVEASTQAIVARDASQEIVDFLNEELHKPREFIQNRRNPYDRDNTIFLEQRKRFESFQVMRLIKSLNFLDRNGIGSATKFADIGCGTASLDFLVTDQYPNVEIFALDKDPEHIECNQEEQGERFPKLKFATGNLMKLPEDFPRDLDMVSSTSLMSQVSDPMQAVKNMSDLLAPGGKLLAEEVDISSIGTAPDKPFPALDRFRELWKEAIKIKGCDPEAGAKLQEYFQEAGLEEIESQSYLVNEPQEAIQNIILETLEDGSTSRAAFETVVSNKDPFVDSSEVIDKLIRDLKKGFAAKIPINFYTVHQVSGIKA